MSKFFIYEPEYDGVTFFHSEKEWKAAMQDYDFLGKFCDDGWSEAVENVVSGIMPDDVFYNEHPENEDDFLEENVFYDHYKTHEPARFNEKQRPPDDEIDENGYCADGYCWREGYEFCCMYHFEEITAN